MQLHPLGIGLGLGLGFLAMGVVTIVGWAALAVLGVDDAATTAVVAGAPVGLVAGSWLAGRTSVRSTFHGALTGLLFAGLVTILSILDGSPAPFATIAGVMGAGLVLGLVAGWAGGRGHHRASQPPGP